jgi:hypothetical protein
VDYLKALLNLNPFLRRRLHAVAKRADMTELEALKTIVESSKQHFAEYDDGGSSN